jgi:hypothetical protein
MKTKDGSIARIGDLVAAAFDGAARYSTDPAEVARLASGVVRLVLRTRCRRAVVSAVQNRRDMKAIAPLWPEDERGERKSGQMS